MIRFLSSRVASKPLVHLSLQSGTSAFLEPGKISPVSCDACCRGVSIAGSDTTHSATASFLFPALEEPFSSVLVKNASHRVSAYGHLAFRPRRLSRESAWFSFRKCFLRKNDEHPHPRNRCPRVREMKIRGLGRVVEESTARFCNPFSDDDQLTS